jgi:L-serine dehydratase
MSPAAFLSVTDLFKIGIGPSSSHTVGPMKAAKLFAEYLVSDSMRSKQVQSIELNIYGSLALTGLGHGTDKAIIAGLHGETPEHVDLEGFHKLFQSVKDLNKIFLHHTIQIPFDLNKHLIWHRNKNLSEHPNGMLFKAFDKDLNVIIEQTYFSVGGGFITTKVLNSSHDNSTTVSSSYPYPFKTGQDLLDLGKKYGLKICEIVMANERFFNSEIEIYKNLDILLSAMDSCLQRGLVTTGTLPGFLKVKRRAPEMYQKLQKNNSLKSDHTDPLQIMDWINAFAIAVNEENASYGRVVTAPTNGAAGIIPAVLAYYKKFIPYANLQGQRDFLLCATAIGALYKQNASLSGAEVGCQGEVGVASSMAAGALTQVLGGSNEQIENAAEIAMEHHLGMTCDPVGGLVQIPCIERNAMGAIKAINASRIALSGDGQHAISLDRVIKTMWETGLDMNSKYKETSRGGLAVNIPEC